MPLALCRNCDTIDLSSDKEVTLTGKRREYGMGRERMIIFRVSAEEYDQIRKLAEDRSIGETMRWMIQQVCKDCEG